MAKKKGEKRDLMVSLEMRTQLLELASVVSKPKGTILFRRGDPGVGTYLIRQGKIKLSLGAENSTFPPRLLETDSIVGLPASVAGSSYSLMAEVVEDAELAFVPREKLIDCLRKNPQICFEVMDLLSHEIGGARSAARTAGSRKR